MKPSLFFVFVVYNLLLPVSSWGITIDRLVAIVNDEVITLSEIDEAEYSLVNNMLNTTEGKAKGVPDRKVIKKKIIDQFIEKKIQLQKAKKLNIKATAENINEVIKEIKGRNNITTDEELKEALAIQGLNLEYLRRQIAERIKITKLINRKVRTKIQVSGDEIKAYHQKHLDEFHLSMEVHARHILLQVPQNASRQREKEIRLRMEKIYAQLKEGAGFAQMAKNFSEAPDANKGGDLGYLKKGQMIPEINNVVFTVKPGEISDIVRTPFGFHIFKVLERKEHNIENDAELRKEIENRIAKKKTEVRLKKYLEELKAEAFISILEVGK